MEEKKQSEKPYKKQAFVDFLNDVNKLSTEKYGFNVVSYDWVNNEILDIMFMPAIGLDAKNRKF